MIRWVLFLVLVMVQVVSSWTLDHRVDMRVKSNDRVSPEMVAMVLDLMQQLDRLEQKLQKKDYVFYIKTPFSGVHIGRSDHIVEAKAKALQQCADAGGGFWCQEHHLKTANPN